MDFTQALRAVQAWAEAHGIQVQQQALRPELAGVFDGLSVRLNPDFTSEEQTYYLVHALGSIIRWSLSQPVVQSLFEELRAAKAHRTDRARLERAIEAYRAFEIESSEFAVELLSQLGLGDAVPTYTNFMRADLEALTELHRTGQAPVWRNFFSKWNADVAAGRRQVAPFHRKSIPAFTPRKIDKQEIIQKQA